MNTNKDINFSISIYDVLQDVIQRKPDWDDKKQWQYAEICLRDLCKISIQEAIDDQLFSQIKMMIKDVD